MVCRSWPDSYIDDYSPVWWFSPFSLSASVSSILSSCFSGVCNAEPEHSSAVVDVDARDAAGLKLNTECYSKLLNFNTSVDKD